MEHEVAIERKLTQLLIGPMAVWMLATVGTGIWSTSTVPSEARSLACAGTGCYAAMVCLTLAGNMPLNAATLRAKAAMDPNQWSGIRKRWNRFHTYRNLLNVAGLTLLALSFAKS